MNRQRTNQLFCILEDAPELTDLWGLCSLKVLAITLESDTLSVLGHSGGTLRVDTYDANYARIKSQEFKNSSCATLGNVVKYKIVQGSHFLVCSDPFRLMMSFKETNTLVPITLRETALPSEGFSCQIVYPSIFVFGGLKEDKTPNSSLIDISMYTFEAQNIETQDACFHLSEDRIYVFGGRDPDNRQITDNLLWTFDLLKKCWFALELQGPPQEFNSSLFRTAELSKGRLTLIRIDSGRIFTLSLYQSEYREEKSKETNLGEVCVPEGLVKRQKQFVCPVVGKEVLLLRVFEDFEGMIQHQMSRQVMC